MGNEFLRSHYLGFVGRHQVLKECVAGNKEVAFSGTAEEKKVIGVGQAIQLSAQLRDQSLSFGQINRQYAQMISDFVELGATRTVNGQKQFLKHNRIDSYPNSPLCFRGKQLYRRWITSDVSDDHVRIQENEWLIRVRTLAISERLGISHLFHTFIVGQGGGEDAQTLDYRSPHDSEAVLSGMPRPRIVLAGR